METRPVTSAPYSWPQPGGTEAYSGGTEAYPGGTDGDGEAHPGTLEA
jgi:hypothetical protein